MTRGRTSRAAALLCALTVAVVASGCAAVAPQTPSASAHIAGPSAMAASVVEGEGATGFPGVAFPIAEGAQSVTVVFTCSGDGPFTVELGDSMMLGQAPLSGACGTSRQLSWPLTERTGETLSVTVADGVAWSAQPTFSADAFATDDALAEDCAAFTDVYSAFLNADAGFGPYQAFDEETWRDRMAGAAMTLTNMASASTSRVAGPLARMRDAVAATPLTPGPDFTAAYTPPSEIAAACDENQTPWFVKAEFGG